MEEWRAVKDYEGLYVVSNTGKVKSLGNGQTHRSEHLLKYSTNHSGYHLVTLTKNGISKTMSVHQVVALAFIPNTDLMRTQLDHIDGDRKNNCVDNLRWCTAKENNSNPITRTRKSKSKTGELNPNHKSNLTEDRYRALMRAVAKAHEKAMKSVEQLSNGVVIGRFDSAAIAEQETGVDATNISRCCLGKRKTAGKFEWRFSNSSPLGVG